MKSGKTRNIVLLLALFLLATFFTLAPHFSKKTPNNISRRCLECQAKADEYNKKMQWKQLPCGLWINKNGDIGLNTTESVCDDGCFVEKYITRMYFSGDSVVELKSIVDLNSFHQEGDFYKDKNHVYEHYDMSDGGNISILDSVDHASFHTIDGCYAKDKGQIYCHKFGVLEADYNTFCVNKKVPCYARDKNGYFFWGDRINLQDLDASELKELKKNFE